MKVFTPVRHGVCLLMLAGLSGQANAISLNDYVTEVVQTHPTVLQNIHSYRQLVEDKTIANKGWRPSVDLTGSIGSYQTESPNTGNVEHNYGSHDLALTLTQNLFDGFDTTHRQDQAQARISSEIYRIYDEADNIGLRAVKLYLMALKHRKLVELAKINIDNHEDILAKIRERDESGVGQRSELEQTEGRVAQAYASLYAAQNNLQDALTQLHFMLGRYVSASELEDIDVPAIPEGELDELIDKALQQHPALKSANFNISAATHDFKRSKSTSYPQVDLKLQKLIGDDIGGPKGDTDEMSAVIHMSYNLYNGGADKAVKQQKLSSVHQYQEFAAQVRREVIENYRLAWMAHTALAGQIEFLNEYQERAGRTVDFYQEEFFIGQRDLLDLLDAESEYNSAQISYTNAYYDNVEATYRVNEGMGGLFTALAIDVKIDDSSLTLASREVNGVDKMPYNYDRDEDKEQDPTDHCDNSLLRNQINVYGCEPMEAEFGYKYQPEIIIENLNFLFDRVELTMESSERLQTVIGNIKRVGGPNPTVVINAHTDSKGSIEYNDKLSQRRAESIKSTLVESGFKEEQLTAIGKGELEPIEDNATEEGRSANRRVEFVVTPENAPETAN